MNKIVSFLYVLKCDIIFKKILLPNPKTVPTALTYVLLCCHFLVLINQNCNPSVYSGTPYESLAGEASPSGKAN